MSTIIDDSWKWLGMKPSAKLVWPIPSLVAPCDGQVPEPVKHVKEIRPLAALALAELFENLLEFVDIPERECRCHLSPPCNDCVEYSGIREDIEQAQELIKEIRS